MVVAVNRVGPEHADLSDMAIVRSEPVLTRFAAIETDSVDGRRLDKAVADASLSSEWREVGPYPSFLLIL